MIKSMGIELSNQCNLKCELCMRNSMIQNNKHFITLKEFKNMKLNNIHLIIGGFKGEPLTNPYFLDIIKTTNKFVNVLTNGNFHDEKWWYDLSKFLPKKHSVTFALDGTDQKTLEIYRRGSDYNRVINNANSFISGGGTAIWQMIMFKHNEHQFLEAEKLSKKFGFSNFSLIPSTIYNSVYQRPTSNIKSAYEYSLEKKKTGNIKCRIEFGKIAITSKGEYSPCCFCFSSEDIIKVTGEPIKYIKDHSLSEIISDGYYDRILERVYTKEIDICKNCNIYCVGRK